MELIQSTTVTGTATTSVVFSSIPQDGTHLFLNMSVRSLTSGNASLTLDITNNGAPNEITIGGSTAVASPSITARGTTNSGVWSQINATIPNYTKVGLKTVIYDGGATTATNAANDLNAYTTTTPANSAITTLTLRLVASGTNQTFETGSRLSLYKLTAGTGGATFA